MQVGSVTRNVCGGDCGGVGCVEGGVGGGRLY